MRRILIIFTALALAACGTGTASPNTTGQDTATTGLLASTTTAGPTTTPTVLPTTTQPPAGTTSVAAVTTTTPIPSTTVSQVPAKMTVAPYFLIDEAGHTNRTGPFLLPVAREVDQTVAVASAAMLQLLAGPTTDESQGTPSISTTIPSNVRLLGLTIGENIATVDLSSEFGATEESATVAQRAAQVVFTLSRFDSISEILFRQEGRSVSIQIGDGSLVSRPVGIDDYLEFAAALSVESPVYGGTAGNPMRVTGFGAVFEATFQYALTEHEGLIIEEGTAMTNNGTGWGGFDFTVDYEVSQRQVGALIVWANSAKDGSRIDIREYPVILTP